MHHPSNDRQVPPLAYTQGVKPTQMATLQDSLTTQVAIIGGGITGLAAALRLAESGVQVTVLEARHAAWGASGRAFGQVVPYLKHGEAEILAHYGPERGARVIEAVAGGPALVARLIDRLGIDCNLRRSGLIFGGHAPAGEQALRDRAAFWQKRGAAVDLLEGAAAQSAIGSDFYRVALLDHRGIHLNPFAYTSGLGAAAIAAGVRIFGGTTVSGLRRDGEDWQVSSGPHTIRAKTVILATNAYSGNLWPGLTNSFVPMRGHGVVSGVLSDNVRRSILPGGQALTDTRRLFSGVRMLPDGRLHASLDGPFFGPEAKPFIGKLNRRIARLFPHLGRLEWEEHWSGFVAMTTDHFPRVHVLAPGLFAGFGYSGRGIAAATMIGTELAERVLGVPDEDLVFPATPVKTIPARDLAPAAVSALVAWYRVQDFIDGRRHGIAVAK